MTDKILDPARWVVTSRDGSIDGSTMLDHIKGVWRDGTYVLCVHGPEIAFGPSAAELGIILHRMADRGHDWISLWRALAIVHLFVSGPQTRVDDMLRSRGMATLRAHLHGAFERSQPVWRRSVHTDAIMKMVEDPLCGVCRDMLIEVSHNLVGAEKLWLVYDRVDDICDDALGGLFRFIYDANNIGLRNIVFKVLLRRDTWNRLAFTNKSHFGDNRVVDVVNV